MARYERTGYGWNDFLEIDLDSASDGGATLRVRRGRLGTLGQERVTPFPSAAKARAAAAAEIKAAKADSFAQAFDLAIPPELPASWPLVDLASPRAEATPAPRAPATYTAGVTDASALHRRVVEALAGQHLPWIEHGIALGLEPRSAALTKRVVEIYSAPSLPEDFDPIVEGAALQLLPHFASPDPASPWVARRVVPIPDATTSLRMAIVDAWIARVGLVGAIDAFAHVGDWMADMETQQLAFYLTQRDSRDLVSALANNADQILRGHLLAADAETRARAKARAEEARARGDLVTRGFFSSAFVEPSWVVMDLEERLRTGLEVPLTIEAVVTAPPQLVERWFAHLSLNELVVFAPYEQTPDLGALVGAYGARAVPIYAALVRRVAEMVQVGAGGLILGHPLLEALLDGLLAIPLVGPSDHVISALVASLQVGRRRSDLLAYLRGAPAASLPWIRAAARHRPSEQMTTLLAQLERVGAHASSAPIADLAALPKPLRAKATFIAPPYWKPALFAPLRLRSGEALPPEAYDALGALLEKGARELADVKAACDPASAAAFAWDVFDAWRLHLREQHARSAGDPRKGEWPMRALAHLGDEAVAHRLGALIREWPSQTEHHRAVRALDVLVKLENEAAMLELAGLAEKAGSAGLRGKARAKIAELAAAKGLTPAELADRLVPTLGMEPGGTLTLDFGGRSFKVGFGPTLEPFVRGEDGRKLSTLPKPGPKDDAARAAEAQATWKRVKKEARTIAALELPRLERAIGSMRTWRAADFARYVARHPVVGHIARGLVWARIDAAGNITGTLRVAEDGTYADIEDHRVELTANDRVRLVGPTDVPGDLLLAWRRMLAEYEQPQPFDQLDRPTFALTEAEREGTSLARYSGRSVPTSRVLSLLRRGWIRGSLSDAMVTHVYRPLEVYVGAGGATSTTEPTVGAELNAVLRVSGFTTITAEIEPEQNLGLLDVSADPPSEVCPRPTALQLGALHPTLVSELLLDLEALFEAR